MSNGDKLLYNIVGSRLVNWQMPRKLSESEKNDILSLYRETGDTTSTLASRYNVSNSTISRLLKSRLPALEYEMLVQQKRAAAGKGQPPQMSSISQLSDRDEEDGEQAIASPSLEAYSTASLSSMLQREETEAVGDRSSSTDEEQKAEASESIGVPIPTDRLEREGYQTQASTLKELLGEDLLEDQEGDLDFDPLNEEDEDDFDDELEDFEEDEDDDRLSEEDQIFSGNLARSTIDLPNKSRGLIEVLPLSEASLPKICYVVIDRSAELITRPLREFGELGQIPVTEMGEQTLPIFDNHRVARRFSKRNQRAIKIPDSKIFHKVGACLQEKGIARLLIGGQVYSL